MSRASGCLLSAVLILGLFNTGSIGGQSSETRLNRLEAGVRAQEAIRAAKRLHYTYSHYLELGLWSDLADLFTDDATAQFQSAAISGKENLRKHFMDEAQRTNLGLAEGQLNSHLELQPIISVSSDGKTVMGTFHEITMLGKFGISASWYGGIYENEYAMENGSWKIRKLHFYPQYSGAYEEFGHKAPAKWNIAYHFDGLHVGLSIPASALDSLAPSSSRESSGTRLAKLTQRVQRMTDETLVENLQHAYGYYLDRKLWDDAADLFSDDGSLEEAQRGIYVGRPHIRKALESIYGAGPLHYGELFDHINLSTVVTIASDGRSASARTTQLSMLGVNGEYARWEEGTYENEFVKLNGTWEFKGVHYFPRMSSNYDKGWAKDALPAPAPSKEFPPDRPATQSFASYPNLSYVALHYVNPATGKAVQYPSGNVTRIQIVTESKPTSVSSIASTKFDAVLSEVEHQLHNAIAVDAVENLNSSYGYFLDESAWDSMADTFSITRGAKEISGAGVYIGRERIRTILNQRGPRGGRGETSFTIHQLTQPVIHVSDDGNSAKARFRLVQLGGSANGSSGSWIGGIYENTALFEDGEWKFGIQDLHHIFNAPYRNGWAKFTAVAAPNTVGSARGGSSLAAQNPPDRPIRSRQYAFPEIDEPAFHYKNPVTGRMPRELLP